jgi:hypothetical protein
VRRDSKCNKAMNNKATRHNNKAKVENNYKNNNAKTTKQQNEKLER